MIKQARAAGKMSMELQSAGVIETHGKVFDVKREPHSGLMFVWWDTTLLHAYSKSELKEKLRDLLDHFVDGNAFPSNTQQLYVLNDDGESLILEDNPDLDWYVIKTPSARKGHTIPRHERSQPPLHLWV